MTYRLDQTPSQPFLSDADQRHLIGIVQLAEHWRKLDGGPAQVEEAQERLTLAFLPAIKHAARSTKVQDPDDALGNALEEFLRAVASFDLNGDVPFHALVSRILNNHISDTDRTSGTIRIPGTPAAKYWRLMHAHGMDVESAYRECRELANGIDPMSFLAIHRVMQGFDSLFTHSTFTTNGGLDKDRENGEYYAIGISMAGVPTPGPEERIVEESLIAWLFTLVTAHQQSILRLIYGFRDDATETLRFDSGYPTGLDLSDAQAAHALGLSRPTVQRHKSAALKIMRTAMQELVDDGDL